MRKNRTVDPDESKGERESLKAKIEKTGKKKKKNNGGKRRRGVFHRRRGVGKSGENSKKVGG